MLCMLLLADADKAAVENASKVTEAQLRNFLNICWEKYVKARIEPGQLSWTALLAYFLTCLCQQGLLSVLSVLSLLVNQVPK